MIFRGNKNPLVKFPIQRLFLFNLNKAWQDSDRKIKESCYTKTMEIDSKQSTAIKKACSFITQSDAVPNLKQVAQYVGLSPSHFHRVFTKALGITPRNFADANRQNRFKNSLNSCDDITGALYASGYGSSSRVYEFTHRYLSVTPKGYQQGGKAPNNLVYYRPVPSWPIIDRDNSKRNLFNTYRRQFKSIAKYTGKGIESNLAL